MLARPDLGSFETELNAYIDNITSEVTLLAMRSGYALGKLNQSSTTRVLRLWFDYAGGASAELRKKFIFARSELVSFEEGLSHLSPATNASRRLVVLRRTEHSIMLVGLSYS